MRVLRAGLAALTLVALSCDDGPSALRSMRRPAAATSFVSGIVLDAETGQPVADAEVQVGGAMVTRTRADGSFSAQAPAGRARVRVSSQGHLTAARELAIGGSTGNSAAFRLFRQGPRQRVGIEGATLRFAGAALEIPRGAFTEGAQVSLTFVPRARIGAAPVPTQFVDAQAIPRRAVGAVVFEGSEPTAVPVRARVPVPDDVAADEVAAHAIDDEGAVAAGIRPEAIADGLASFVLPRAGRYAIVVDARGADGGKVGYLVTDDGDGMTGAVLTGPDEVITARRASILVDPQGTTVEAEPATRARVLPVEQEVATARRGRSAAFTGDVELKEGGVRVVVARAGEATPAVRMRVATDLATFEATGTAFAVHSCAPQGLRVTELEVVEGTVTATYGGRSESVGAGQLLAICTGCAPGRVPPACPTTAAAPDGGVGLGFDGGVPDAGAVDAGPVPDGSVVLEGGSPPVDASAVLEAPAAGPDAATADGMAMMIPAPDTAAAPTDLDQTPTPDAGVPGSDAGAVQPDATAAAPDGPPAQPDADPPPPADADPGPMAEAGVMPSPDADPPPPADATGTTQPDADPPPPPDAAVTGPDAYVPPPPDDAAVPPPVDAAVVMPVEAGAVI